MEKGTICACRGTEKTATYAEKTSNLLESYHTDSFGHGLESIFQNLICVFGKWVQHSFDDGKRPSESRRDISLAVKAAKRCCGTGLFAIAYLYFWRSFTRQSNVEWINRITEDFLIGSNTMRRMMHAAIVFLLAASVARAQLELRPNQSTSTAANSFPTEFIPDCGNLPYSQLATFMNCNDCSPNLWNNYSSQRAALAAHHSRHVDGQCCRFDHKNCSHGQSIAPRGSHGGRTDGKAARDVPINRYAASANGNQDRSPACKSSCDHKLSGGSWTFSSLYNSSGSKLGLDKSWISLSSLHVSPAPTSGTPCLK